MESIKERITTAYEKNIPEKDLAFDSLFYTRAYSFSLEYLEDYERYFYGDKPQEIVELEKEIRSSPFGIFSLASDKQKTYSEYNDARTKKDFVLQVHALCDDFLDTLKYVQTVLSRQYEKLNNQPNGEEIIEQIKIKAGKRNEKPSDVSLSPEEEMDPFLLLVTRTNMLKEFQDDYITQVKKISDLAKKSDEFIELAKKETSCNCAAERLLTSYAVLLNFAKRYAKSNNIEVSNDFTTSDIALEITNNREFIKNNQAKLNKLTKPHYVALEHSKLVAVTKQIMDPNNPIKAIRVDQKGTVIEASITTDEKQQSARIDSFDTLVEEAIGCIIDNNIKTFEKNGYVDVPLSAIAQQVLILNSNAHISKEQSNAITTSMNKLRHIFVNINFTAQAEAHKKLKIDKATATIEDNALNYTKTTVIYKGNTIDVYRIHSYPPRYKYSKSVRQISGVSRELIYLPNMNITRGVAILRRYLVEYIESLKNNPKLSRTIFFETINKACEGQFAYESKESRRDFRKKVTSMLDGFQLSTYILEYEIVKEGRELKGVRIEPNPNAVKNRQLLDD